MSIVAVARNPNYCCYSKRAPRRLPTPVVYSNIARTPSSAATLFVGPVYDTASSPSFWGSRFWDFWQRLGLCAAPSCGAVSILHWGPLGDWATDIYDIFVPRAESSTRLARINRHATNEEQLFPLSNCSLHPSI
jgi:hypothetical protein